MAMKSSYVQRLALLLSILIIDHVFPANSVSFKQHRGTVFSGRDRMLREQSPPPPPRLGLPPHYKFYVPPPPPLTTQRRSTAPNFRVVGKGAPPTPQLSRPRNFGVLPSPPPAPPLPQASSQP